MVFGADFVEYGNFADGLCADAFVEIVHLHAAGIRGSGAGKERLLRVFDVSVFRPAENGKKTSRAAHGVERVLDERNGNGIQIDDLAAPFGERAVFADEEQLFPYGKKQFF